MDDIKQRLTEATEACLKTLDAWRAKPEQTTRESLQDAVHELRKVGARLEIELAVSDRKSQNSDPIPIPSHRASRRQGPEAEQMGDDEGSGNRQGSGNRSLGSNRDRQGGGGASRPVQIRQKEEGAAAAAPAAAQPGNDSAAPAAEAGADAGDRKGKPLSLRRSSADSE